MVEMVGAVCPAGKRLRYPAVVGWVTATLIETAVAVEGVPQEPAMVKARVACPCITGPPLGVLGLRVSTARHGATVK